MARRRLIVHCGVQKTASTSLHHFLQRNAEVLADVLEVLTPARGTLTRRLGRAAMQFSLDPSPERQAVLSGLAASLRDGLRGGEVPVLLSHENLAGAMMGKGGVVTLYPRFEKIMDLLDAALAPYVPEYVIYTREMSDWKRSVHSQAVRSDGYPGSLGAFLEETAGCGTWEDLAERMVAHAGERRVRVFRLEDEIDETRPGLQLLRHAGVPETRLAALRPLSGRRNRGLNAGALEFVRLLNGLNLDVPARARIVDLVSANQNLFVAEGA